VSAFYAQLSDAELLERVRKGERDAYAGLVERHQQAVYRHARAMGLDYDTSCDLVQDTFVKAYTRQDACRDPARFRFWLFRIGRNLCLDHLKSVRRLSVPLSQLANAEIVLHTEATDADTGSTIRAALDRLPLALREAFLLKHDSGYTYDEIAELTNATPSAVKMRVHRAREALQTFLAEQGVRAA
jgi:RNA polymerase sigma-70 factor (ECF subfamily)